MSCARTVYLRQHAPRAGNVPGICARYHAHMKATLVLACRGARAQACGAQHTWLTRDDQERGACTALCDAMERELTLGCNARKRSTDRVPDLSYSARCGSFCVPATQPKLRNRFVTTPTRIC